jgi:drug/metabolite transporter (DMT)-like permease
MTLALSACCAAVGQIMLKLGAEGQQATLGLVNLKILTGLALYGVGMLLWLYGLARVPLHAVYPFTLLTMALVFALSILWLGERPGSLAIAGWLVVCTGVGLVVVGSRA